MESSYASLFNHTADSRAANKAVMWYLVNLCYLRKDNEEEIDPILTKYEKFPVKDLLHTFVIHIALKISSQFPSEGKILVTGGGVYNEFLINQILKKSKCELVKPSSDLIEFKEALIFGFLGVLKLRNEINCFSSVTGAKKDHSSGVIYNI